MCECVCVECQFLRESKDVSFYPALVVSYFTLEIYFGIYPFLPTPSTRAGYDTRSIFKRSLTGFFFRVFLLLD